MDDPSIHRVGAPASFRVAIAYLLTGICAVLMPPELQGRPEITPFAKDMREANARGEALGLSEDALAFYDAHFIRVRTGSRQHSPFSVRKEPRNRVNVAFLRIGGGGLTEVSSDYNNRVLL